jgi:regulatory protein SWI5
MDERLDKASRTRQQVLEQQDPYTSSNYSSSPSSWGSPPTENMENLSIRGTSPFDNMQLFDESQGTMGLDPMMAFAPENFSFTPPTSPGYSTGNKPSPSYRELTPADLGEIPEFHPSQASNMVSDFSTMGRGVPMMGMGMSMQNTGPSLPSLSNSCSSPAGEGLAFDFSDLPAESSSFMQSSQLPMKLESDRNDFDSFLDYGSMEMGTDTTNPDFFVNLS